MFPWKRPDPHDEFDADAKTLLARLRDDVAARGGQPQNADFANREIWSGTWSRRGQPAGLHKVKLLGPEPKVAKCVWCERYRDWERELDVEHFRPKSEVAEWQGDPPIISDVPPRQHEIGPGYWWLAFAWDNYSLACKTCNQGWKRNLFPVATARGACVEGGEVGEQPLLLDPGSSFRPRDHFRWTPEGIMEPVSPQGRATIVTCGLNRSKLLARRLKVAVDTHRAIEAVLRAWRRDDEPACARVFATVLELGSPSSEFTSMVRWFVEEKLCYAWE